MQHIEDQLIIAQIDNHGNYVFEQFIGKGGFGRVCKALKLDTGEAVAIKAMSKKSLRNPSCTDIDKYSMKRTTREIQHHKRLSGHPLIVEFKEAFVTENFLCIVMEFAQGGDMMKYIQESFYQDQLITEDEARQWFQQLIIATKFCHAKDIVNRDMKLQNILRSQTAPEVSDGWWGVPGKFQSELGQSWTLRVCDFGYSKDLIHNSNPTSKVGSLPYNPPEVLFSQGQKYDAKKKDIWACGVVLYCLLVGSLPFDPRKYTYKIKQLHQKIQDADYEYPENCPCSAEVRELISHMLEPSPDKRYDADQIISHPWFQENLPENWCQRYDDIVNQHQQTLQSDQDIEDMIQRIFAEEVQDPLQGGDADQIISHPWFQENLPENWCQRYDDIVNQHQQTLQSDQDIEDMIQRIFAEEVQDPLQEFQEYNSEDFPSGDFY
eukprot:TRINITY_DN5865_c0_g2_i4.p1 TRINITY_DN5865_c0_g2~~TRINITY_DN5865_c0_g2_i4.p1  ORF type:complete len:435 (+),score=51.57 TRINITY_DN5865_c0_g2_i4:95-1399(+)